MGHVKLNGGDLFPYMLNIGKLSEVLSNGMCEWVPSFAWVAVKY